MQHRLKIENLELQVYLGWPEAERQALQQVLVKVTLQFNGLPTAALSDDLKDTVCYAQIADALMGLNQQSFKLLEHLGHRCYELIQPHAQSATKIELSITKFLSSKEGARTFELIVE
jgi:7,8-dihydroneopterin aldolase/epimerase/oxygenase